METELMALILSTKPAMNFFRTTDNLNRRRKSISFPFATILINGPKTVTKLYGLFVNITYYISVANDVATQ